MKVITVKELGTKLAELFGSGIINLSKITRFPNIKYWDIKLADDTVISYTGLIALSNFLETINIDVDSWGEHVKYSEYTKEDNKGTTIQLRCDEVSISDYHE